MKNDIAHRLSPSEAFWQVMVKDSETSWLLDIRTATNPTDTFNSSQDIGARNRDSPSRAGRFQTRLVFGRTEQDKDRAGQDRAGLGKEKLISLNLVPLIFW